MTPRTAPLTLSAFVVRGEPIPFADAVRGAFAPFHVGEPWGAPWSTTWFRVRGRVPEQWRGLSVVAMLDLGFDGPTGFTCEALAWKDGKPWRGVDPNHPWLPIDTPDVDFYLEAAANPRATESVGDPEVSMLALRRSPDPAFVFGQAELAVIAPDAPFREAPPDPAHVITATGHAHIDTAWEWPLREGKRKVARSWSTQIALMDAFPDFVFAASQPAQYAWMKESYPDIFRRIEEKVRAGQWEPVGGMWVEADCNLPSGEALVRQLVHGQRFFQREFGRTTRILWLPDVFGYPGNLPQIMAEAGCEFFLTQKLSWNDTNKPEHHTFFWEGIDGTRVFTHFPPADTYNGDFSVDELERTVRNFRDADRSSHVLYLYGWGDGGGGPQPEMIEAAHRMDVRLGGAEDFFAKARAEVRDPAVVKGELYFELHRGTYTTQSRTKRLNREAQRGLREAEMWSVAAGGRYPSAELAELWRTLLLNQFHDILPGSSIDWVYEDAERDLGQVVSRARTVTDSALKRIAAGGARMAAFNPSSHERAGIPPCGWKVLSGESEILAPARVSSRTLENDILRLEWDARARLVSIRDKEIGREVLGGPGNVLALHDDNPKRWDAWDLDAGHRDSAVEVCDIEVLDWRTDEARGLHRFMHRFGDSTLEQTVSLVPGSRVVMFETDVDWHERHKILKVAFPVTVSAREATYEIQFGHIRRPTDMDTPQARAMFEVCAQRWADLGDGDYGVALLNDSKHGYDIHDSVMRLSLLRAPTHPDPTADQGRHRFVYALMPHPADFRKAGVIDAAESLNAPLRFWPTSLPPGTSRSLVEVGTPQVKVEAIKRAEESDAVIIRLYEAWGEPCSTRLRSTLPAARAYLCDLLERNRHEIPVDDGEVELELAPFKIVTLKLEP